MKKIKVMFIPPTALPIPSIGGGAIEQLLTNLIDINEEKGKFDFTVVSVYDKDAEGYKYKNTDIYYFKNDCMYYPYISNIRLLWKLYNIWVEIFKNHLSIKFTKKKFYRMDYFTFQCYCLAKKNKADIIVNEGRGQLERYNAFNSLVGDSRVFYHLHHNRKENMFERSFVNNSISISNYVKNEWIKSDSYLGCNEVLYNGIDIDKFKDLDLIYDSLSIRKELGLDKNDFVVLFCGRIIPEKGINELLNAFEMINNPHIKLLVIGSVAFSSSEVTEYSKCMVDRMNELKNVNYLGYIHNDLLPKYYCVSDMQIVPSIWQEGAGLVCIEGMAAGLPLVVTNSGGMVEYVDNNCAIKIEIDDKISENLANAIINLFNNPDKRSNMGTSGKKRAELFSREKYYDNFYKICKRCLKEK